MRRALIVVTAIGMVSMTFLAAAQARPDPAGSATAVSARLDGSGLALSGEVRPVHAGDLDGELARFERVVGGDAGSASVPDDLSPRGEEALASIVAATTDSIVERRDAARDGDRQVLVGSTKRLIETVRVHLPALRDLEGVPTSGGPDVDLPPWLAIDLGGNTTYVFDYILKVDVAGADTHLDDAGGAVGGCFVPCPDTSVTVDVQGADVYDTGEPRSEATWDAYQGAARGYFAAGVLVDGGGGDRYRVTGNLSGGRAVARLSQGAAAAYAAGALVDLGGDDVYVTNYTALPSTNGTDCELPCHTWIAAQGAAIQQRGVVDPGWSLLHDRSGDDVYRARVGPYPAQGVLHHDPNVFDAALEQGAAALVDLGGADVYDGGHPGNADGVRRVERTWLSVEAFVDAG